VLLSQVGQGVLIETVGDVPGVQQLQEVDPTLAAGACDTRANQSLPICVT